MIKLRLVACERYNFRGELYERGKVYSVGENKATLMLRQQDTFSRNYFAKYREVPKKSAKELAAIAAEAAAVAAALEAEAEGRVEAVVQRPDGSEPNKVEVEEVVAQPVEVKVDTDDDPALDEDNKPNPEEVVVDEKVDEKVDEADEDADRADGSEVEV